MEVREEFKPEVSPDIESYIETVVEESERPADILLKDELMEKSKIIEAPLKLADRILKLKSDNAGVSS